MKHSRPPLSLLDALQIYAFSLAALLVLLGVTHLMLRWLKLPNNAPNILMISIVLTAAAAAGGLAVLDVFSPHDPFAPKTPVGFFAGVIHAVMAGGILALAYALLSGARWRLTDTD